MRPATALMQLYLLAPVVLCSPIPLVLAGDLQAVLAAAHPPAPVAASRPEHALPEVVPVQSGDAGAKETSIDNRPLTPSATAQPSAVLASHRPIVTEYLLSLTHRPRPWRKIGSPAVVKLPADAVGAVGSSSVAPMKMSIAAEEVEVLVRMGAPCYHIRLGPGNNDVLVVILIVVFLALVVVVEMFRSATRLLSKRGGIRLEDQPGGERREPLSVQAQPPDEGREKPVL